jgi:small subunit ribosomal protein S6
LTTYELLVIHSPLLTEEQHREQLDRVKDVITRNEGQPGKEDVWGRRRLAYPIRNQRDGYYAVLHFDAPTTGTCLAELERFCKIEETVLRHLVTRAVLDKSLGTPIAARGEAEAQSATESAPQAAPAPQATPATPEAPEPAPAAAAARRDEPESSSTDEEGKSESN